MARSLHDYILSTGGIDWLSGYAPWADILPARSQLILVSRFADAFVEAADGVFMLDVNLGSMVRLADDRAHFVALMDARGPDWLMIPLVDACVEAGRRLLPGQCYAFTRAPVHGGAYRPENVHAAETEAHLAALGALYRGRGG